MASRKERLSTLSDHGATGVEVPDMPSAAQVVQAGPYASSTGHKMMMDTPFGLPEAAGLPGRQSDSKISSIEKIDIAGDGANVTDLGRQDRLGASGARSQLMVTGDGDDQIVLSNQNRDGAAEGRWTWSDRTVSQEDATYQVYEHASMHIELLVGGNLQSDGGAGLIL